MLQGLGISVAGIIGGCSRVPISESRFAELVESLEGKGEAILDRFWDEAGQWIEKPDSILARTGGDSRTACEIFEHENDYADYVASLGLTYIKPHELMRPHRNVRSGVANQLPSRALWPAIAPTLRVADEIRERLGSRLNLINSAYRSPAYNAACPGAAKYSFHLRNKALDLMFDCGPTKAFAVAKQLRSEGFFEGGIGLYSSFVHVDTRGYRATW